MSDLDFILELLSRMAEAEKDKTSIHTELSMIGWNRKGVSVNLTFDDGKLTGISVY